MKKLSNAVILNSIAILLISLALIFSVDKTEGKYTITVYGEDSIENTFYSDSIPMYKDNVLHFTDVDGIEMQIKDKGIKIE